MNTITMIIKRHIPLKRKRKLKAYYNKYKKKLIDLAFSYSYSDLLKTLKQLGIRQGDVLMVHSSINYFSGFQGTAQDVIKAFKEVIDPDKGTLLMVSLPYTTSTLEYLKKTDVFNVKRTGSKMGIISEIFRRQRGVMRSLHPTHPVLAFGHLAEWFVQDHEKCIYPCGPGSPFEKLAQIDGKVLFFDVPFNTFTFIHHIEHLIRDNLPFPLYDDKVFEVKVIDNENKEINVKTKAFSKDAVYKRRPEILEKRLLSEKKIKKQQIGNTNLMLLKTEDAISCAKNMAGKGILFYDFDIA